MREEIENIVAEVDADYVEVRLEDRRKITITYRGKEIDEHSNNRSTGGFIRVLNDGGWGFASFSDVEQLPRILKKAERASRKIRNKNVNLASVKPTREEVKTEMINDPSDFSIDVKDKMLSEYNRIILEPDEVQTSYISYIEEKVNKELYTSEGTSLKQEYTDMLVVASAISRRGENIQQSFETEYSSRDFKKFLNMDEKIHEVTQRAIDLLEAEPAKSGRYDIIIDPRLAGVFAHEAFGHLSEADFVSQNEKLKDVMKLQRRFGGEFLNIIDDGTIEDLPGCHRYDDEGVPMKKTHLIKEGKLVGRLHNRETAANMDEPLSGNARAVNFFYEPVVRMSCTYIDSGDWDLDEMVKDIEKGYYVRYTRGGQTSLEQFTFSGEEAFLIEDGEIGPKVRDVNFSGNLFTTLGNIDAVGKDLKILPGGSCGKGRHFPLPVSYGGPHVRIREVSVGGG